MMDLPASLIRYWEGEFTFLNPHKNAKGDRRFTSDNLGQLKIIHHLVKEKGFTLEGARREISVNKTGLQERLLMIDRLQAVKMQLLALRRQLLGNNEPPSN
ncbi:MAG: MerR family transcriptional regulator [Lewinella sp.]|nr:MerR family transcriptional regulator [Lewinella sp.]